MVVCIPSITSDFYLAGIVNVFALGNWGPFGTRMRGHRWGEALRESFRRSGRDKVGGCVLRVCSHGYGVQWVVWWTEMVSGWLIEGRAELADSWEKRCGLAGSGAWIEMTEATNCGTSYLLMSETGSQSWWRSQIRDRNVDKTSMFLDSLKVIIWLSTWWNFSQNWNLFTPPTMKI